jgi:hypothetical protein
MLSAFALGKGCCNSYVKGRCAVGHIDIYDSLAGSLD